MRKGIFGRFWYHNLSFTKRKQAGLSGYQDRAESHSQLCLFSLPDPGGNPALLDSQEATRPLPLPFLSAGSLGTGA